jgi:cytochrome c551/c552
MKRTSRACCRPRAAVLAAGAFGIALLATTAQATEPGAKISALALQAHCDECHTLDTARIGPPFIAVAARYSAKGESAVEPLAQKIIHGGAGNWGYTPMVPNERISLDEARTLVRWILSLQPS